MDDFIENKLRYIKFIITLGICFLILGLVSSVFETQLNLDDFWISLFVGWGVIFVIMGIIRYYMYTNKSIAKRYKIAETDERSIFLRGHASYLTFVFSITALAILTVIFLYLRIRIAYVLTLSLLIIEYLVFLILTRYYNKKF